MKYTAISTLILAAGSILNPTARAQDHRANVTIPFSFTVGNTTLPPGKYQVSAITNSHNVLKVSGSNKAGIMVIGLPGRDASANTNKVVFHKYGDRYFLTEVCSQDSSINLHFLPSKAEKRAQAEVLQAMQFPEDPILLAMN